jgi:Ca-activated chloride channel family protein
VYDSVLDSYRAMEQTGDPDHIRAIIVLSDGQDTASTGTFEGLMAELRASNTEGGNAIKVFTIAFGEDADLDVLKQIADATGGRRYASDPATIRQVYTEIATFF